MDYTSEQMSKLWAFMQEDIKADRISARMHRSTLRQKLEKLRDGILRQREEYRSLEEQITAMSDRVETIKLAMKKGESQLNSLEEQYRTQLPEDPADVQDLVNAVIDCRDTLAMYEKELKDLQRGCNGILTRLPRLIQGISEGRKQFDEMKVDYTRESEELKKEEKAQRARAEALRAGIPDELMETYTGVKRQTTPPMAYLEGNMCTGCNTALPNAAFRRMQDGGLVKCETCGRILITK